MILDQRFGAIGRSGTYVPVRIAAEGPRSPLREAHEVAAPAAGAAIEAWSLNYFEIVTRLPSNFGNVKYAFWVKGSTVS